ncbi:MAG TPA: acylphosphatase [Candidatus Binataceae bacterium]|nr:acylphosphatase [Candidatus Binataceae bacterium]
MAADRARVRLRVEGRVQGVMFRAEATDAARILGIAGYARNLVDGAVEVVAEGRRTNLEAFIAWAHTGARLAQVTRVDEEWLEFKGEFTSFTVR